MKETGKSLLLIIWLRVEFGQGTTVPDWNSALAVVWYRIFVENGYLCRIPRHQWCNCFSKTRVLFITKSWEAPEIFLNPQHSLTSILILQHLLPLPPNQMVLQIQKPWVILVKHCGVYATICEAFPSLIHPTWNMLHRSPSPLHTPSSYMYLSTKTCRAREKGLKFASASKAVMQLVLNVLIVSFCMPSLENIGMHSVHEAICKGGVA